MLLANVGLPMIFVELPFLAVALVPVAVLEAAIYRWRLSVPWRPALWGALRANLWSTFVGVPLAWLAQVAGQIAVGGGSAWGLDAPLGRLAAVTVQSAWLIPYEGEFGWMVPAASLCLLLPCLLVSVGVEQRMLRQYWPDVPGRGVVGAVLIANVLSYLLLAGYWGVQLSSALAAKPA
jgi:hypothetical protein